MNLFSTTIYLLEKKEWVNDYIFFTDKYIEQVKKNNEQYFINNKDFGMSHHSEQLLQDINFNKFIEFINKESFNILDQQGYDMNLYVITTIDLWVQEFSKEGGGRHNSHIHSNSHVSGFYFLKCSDKTSYPVFHDPRLNKKMIQLKEKDETKTTYSSEKIYIKPVPGLFVLFNSYLEHEFVIDHGIDPFRFIHFNLQAIPKNLIS
jgi:uncharacterized protein (TIGR02466 family)